MSIKKSFGIEEALNLFGIKDKNPGTLVGEKSITGTGEYIESSSPVDGGSLGSVDVTSKEAYDQVIEETSKAFKEWRMMPAPKRGEIIRQIGEALREYKEPLGKLVSYEMGKSLQEGYGEVQEMIDICDFAVGLSRQLYGLTMHSERPGHRMYEQYHPLGVVGIISAFNFPVAVWSWNSMLAWVCGDVCIWKPSEKTPITALACQKITTEVLKKNNVPTAISCVINGDYKVGEMMTSDKRVPLISATGSIRMGKIVAQAVGARLGKTLLELGGNNAIIISKDADLDIAIRGALFGAVGTAGQRCTSTRRLIIHEDVYDEVKERLVNAYGKLKIGNPLDQSNQVGPLIDTHAVDQYTKSIEAVKAEGGTTVIDGEVLKGEEYETGTYVKPAIFEVENHFEIVQHETFAPILYMMKYSDLEDAIEMQNAVPQGLSSAIMSTNIRETEMFLSHAGSDCGIANVNIGTSGAEIGGAFGGEKETGGGRESGSDAWKVYMRRQTNTINYSTQLPLAQGIEFDI
ncbi:L-piperidine-6-carboxylate dehydrogenase [Mangrovivirga cuniculi]|uniref:aldehyde dehydrogenase (NAD(+)) n=1 Tax=Mangrovivirga cuniculi TaxID=2715131 RepID=A0A4D7JHS6_9BACT|nr:aldehyde dehydrogenase family protein [Mangrovivirga cuniculi]QCK14257.1 aldehyde dehydrogenase family protein [Mangrovivirga cuniculi]